MSELKMQLFTENMQNMYQKWGDVSTTVVENNPQNNTPSGQQLQQKFRT